MMPEFDQSNLGAALALTVLGFVFLLYSGDCLVRGALAAAHKMDVSPLLVGIVVVGFGTSLPELFIAFQAAMTGGLGLAHGNIVGSNISNIWLVLAVPAIIFPVATFVPRMRAMTIFMILATVSWVAITLFVGLNQIVGIAFLIAMVAGMVLAWSFGHKDHAEYPDAAHHLHGLASWRMIVLILIGVLGLPLGSKMLIEGGIAVAGTTGASEEVIGLTLLAVGTSLPELAAGIAASWRRHGDVSIGNILGSNIFNLLGAGGVVALTGAHKLSTEFHDYSHWALLASALMVGVVVFLRRKIAAPTAVVFLVCFAVYLFGLIQGWGFDGVRVLVEQGLTVDG